MSKQIKLTRGKIVIVDDEDFGQLNQHKWCVSKTTYGSYVAVRRCRCFGDKKPHTILMHRQITSCPKNKDIDHIDHNTLNNQRANLRICNRSQNMGNSKTKLHSSKFKGVCWANGGIYKGKRYEGRWMAQIMYNYKNIFLGYYDSEIEAAFAYNVAAKKYFGEFAKLNVA